MAELDRGCVTEFFDICERRGIAVVAVSKMNRLYGVWINDLEAKPIAVAEKVADAVVGALRFMGVSEEDLQRYAAERYAEGK